MRSTPQQSQEGSADISQLVLSGAFRDQLLRHRACINTFSMTAMLPVDVQGFKWQASPVLMSAMRQGGNRHPGGAGNLILCCIAPSYACPFPCPK